MTMVEILVVIAVLAVLMGLLLPTLSRVREHSGETTCASNLRQLAAATLAYRAAWKDHLPQIAALSPFSGEDEIIGALFGGKRGELDIFGINEIGADRRPLNAYLATSKFSADTASSDPDIGTPDDTRFLDEHVPAFLCPLDRGQPAQPSAFLEAVLTMYDYIGTSYTLNDHALDSEDCWTLIPDRTPPCDPDPGNPDDQRPGGRMPRVEQPTKTWMIGDQPIYNYQQLGDRLQRWHFKKVQVNLAFLDGHVGIGIPVPKSSLGPVPCLDVGQGRVEHIEQNTTPFYTFLPNRDWLCPQWLQRYCNSCP